MPWSLVKSTHVEEVDFSELPQYEGYHLDDLLHHYLFVSVADFKTQVAHEAGKDIVYTFERMTSSIQVFDVVDIHGAVFSSLRASSHRRKSASICSWHRGGASSPADVAVLHFGIVDFYFLIEAQFTDQRGRKSTSTFALAFIRWLKKSAADDALHIERPMDNYRCGRYGSVQTVEHNTSPVNTDSILPIIAISSSFVRIMKICEEGFQNRARRQYYAIPTKLAPNLLSF